jgi:transcriptional regulator with XRE-family HTH domain
MGKIARRVDAFVGGRIRERRTEMGLTQENLATALQISYQQVQKYEAGTNRVSAGRLFEIARKLEVDVAYFYQGLDPSLEVEPLDHGGKSRSVIELVQNFGEISDPELRAAINGLVKSLAHRRRRPSAAAV